MRANEYLIMEHAVEQNLCFVWRRAFKHDENPPIMTDHQHEVLQEAISAEVMNGIAEWFTFDEDDENGDLGILIGHFGRIRLYSEHGLHLDLKIKKLGRSLLSSIRRMVQQWRLAIDELDSSHDAVGSNQERGIPDSVTSRDSVCAGHHRGERVHDAHPPGDDPRTRVITAFNREGQT